MADISSVANRARSYSSVTHCVGTEWTYYTDMVKLGVNTVCHLHVCLQALQQEPCVSTPTGSQTVQDF